MESLIGAPRTPAPDLTEEAFWSHIEKYGNGVSVTLSKKIEQTGKYALIESVPGDAFNASDLAARYGDAEWRAELRWARTFVDQAMNETHKKGQRCPGVYYFDTAMPADAGTGNASLVAASPAPAAATAPAPGTVVIDAAVLAELRADQAQTRELIRQLTSQPRESVSDRLLLEALKPKPSALEGVITAALPGVVTMLAERALKGGGGGFKDAIEAMRALDEMRGEGGGQSSGGGGMAELVGAVAKHAPQLLETIARLQPAATAAAAPGVQTTIESGSPAGATVAAPPGPAGTPRRLAQVSESAGGTGQSVAHPAPASPPRPAPATPTTENPPVQPGAPDAAQPGTRPESGADAFPARDASRDAVTDLGDDLVAWAEQGDEDAIDEAAALVQLSMQRRTIQAALMLRGVTMDQVQAAAASAPAGGAFLVAVMPQLAPYSAFAVAIAAKVIEWQQGEPGDPGEPGEQREAQASPARADVDDDEFDDVVAPAPQGVAGPTSTPPPTKRRSKKDGAA